MKVKTENTVPELLSEDELIQEWFERIHNKIQQIKDYYKKKRKELKDQKDDDLEKLKQYLKDSGESLGRSVSDTAAGQIQEEVEERGRRIRALYVMKNTILNRQEMLRLMKIKKIQKVTKGTLVASGIVLSGGLIQKAYSTYKDEMKKAKSVCSGKTGKERAICIEKYKIKLLKKRFNFLNSIIVHCKETKDPVKCRVAINKEKERVKNLIHKELQKVGEDFSSSSIVTNMKD